MLFLRFSLGCIVLLSTLNSTLADVVLVNESTSDWSTQFSYSGASIELASTGGSEAQAQGGTVTGLNASTPLTTNEGDIIFSQSGWADVPLVALNFLGVQAEASISSDDIRSFAAVETTSLNPLSEATAVIFRQSTFSVRSGGTTNISFQLTADYLHDFSGFTSFDQATARTTVQLGLYSNDGPGQNTELQTSLSSVDNFYAGSDARFSGSLSTTLDFNVTNGINYTIVGYVFASSQAITIVPEPTALTLCGAVLSVIVIRRRRTIR